METIFAIIDMTLKKRAGPLPAPLISLSYLFKSTQCPSRHPRCPELFGYPVPEL